MPKISKQKQKKIEEQILYFLYNQFPKLLFTVDIARELARDEEFIKSILISLEKRDLVLRVNKNPEGIIYQRRLRWRISNKTYLIYKEMQ